MQEIIRVARKLYVNELMLADMECNEQPLGEQLAEVARLRAELVALIPSAD